MARKSVPSLMPDSIPVSISVAQKYGVCAALLFQQIHYRSQTLNNVIDGRKWVHKTHREWSDEFGGIYKPTTIRDALHQLEREGLILVGSFNKWSHDNTKWYTVNYQRIGHTDFGGGDSEFRRGICQFPEEPPPKTALALPEIFPERYTEMKYIPTDKPLGKEDLKMQIIKNHGGKVIKPPPRKVSSSDAILADLQRKNHDLPQVPPNSKKSWLQIWNTIPQFNDTVKMVPALTQKDLKYLYDAAGQWGPTSDVLLSYVVQHWLAFTTFVASQRGLSKAKLPAAPTLWFLRQYAGEVPNFHAAKSVQAVAPKPKKIIKVAKPEKASTMPPPKTTGEEPASADEVEAMLRNAGVDL